MSSSALSIGTAPGYLCRNTSSCSRLRAVTRCGRRQTTGVITGAWNTGPATLKAINPTLITLSITLKYVLHTVWHLDAQQPHGSGDDASCLCREVQPEIPDGFIRRVEDGLLVI